MAEKPPICNYDGVLKELQSGDTLPSSGSGLPDTYEGTAGEALDHYDVVYSNSADSGEHWIATNDGTSAQADAVGIVVESGGIADTATGTIHRLGPLTNESWTWTPGATLWLGIDGAIVETMPSAGNYAKPLGYAETATKIWFAPQNGWLVGFDVELSEVPPGHTGRIELVSSSQISWTGYKYPGWDAAKGRDIEIIPSSVPVLNYNDKDIDGNPLVAAYPYDLYLETVSATSAVIKAKKFTNATTRAVTPALWHGRERYDNTTDTGKKRLWIGTIYMDTGPVFVSSPSDGKLFVWNKFNQKKASVIIKNTTSNWTYSTNAWRELNGGTGQQRAQLVLGEATILPVEYAMVTTSTAGRYIYVSTSLDSTSATPSMYTRMYMDYGLNESGLLINTHSAGVGYHYATILENSSSSGEVYVYGTSYGSYGFVEVWA